MIRPAQSALVHRAGAAVASDPAEFAALLHRCGGADRVETLTRIGFERLMDHFTVTGFRSRQRPMLSAATRKLIETTRRELFLSDHVYTADLRGYAGVVDLRDLVGQGLIALLARWERRGLIVANFAAARREITPKQLRLLQLARKRIGIEDVRYYKMIQDYGGVVSAADLDTRGFDLCMAFLEAEGFDREPLKAHGPSYGRRAGFASPEQVELIRSLWRAWIGPTSDSEDAIEAGLNAWLERYHHTSSLRFLTAQAAGKVIGALRIMQARRGNRLHDVKEHDHAAHSEA